MMRNSVIGTLKRYAFSPEILGLALRGFQAVSMFGLSALLARHLGPEDFGIYSYALSWLVFLGLAAQLGLVPTVIREIPSLLLKENKGGILSLWGSSNYLVLMSSVAIAIGVVLLVALDLVPSIYHKVLLISVPAVFFIGQASLTEAVIRGYNKPILGQLNQLLFRPGLGLLAVGLCLVLFPALLDAQGAMMIQVLAALVGAIAINALSRRLMAKGRWTLDRPEIVDLARRTSWLTLSSILNASAAFVPVLFLGFFSSVYQVGLFVVAFQTTILILLGSVVANNQYGPLLASAYAREDYAEMQKFATSACRFSVLIASILFVPLALFHVQFVTLAFGAEFVEGSSSLLLLAFVQMLHAIFGAIGIIMMTIREERKMFLAQLAGLAVQTAIFALAIPSLGAFGGALGVAAAALFFNGVLFYVIFHKVGVVTLPIGKRSINRT